MRRIKTNSRSLFSSLSNKLLLAFLIFSLVVGLSVFLGLFYFFKASLTSYSIDNLARIDIEGDIWQMGAGIILLLTMLSGLVSLFLSRTIMHPVNLLKKMAHEVKQGKLSGNIDPQKTGDLKEVFELLQETVADGDGHEEISDRYSMEMEGVIAQKTRELKAALEKMDKDKEELKKQRSAILNILEDVQESQESLERSKQDLENRHYQLEILKSLSDNLTSVFEVSEAAEQVYLHLKKITNADVVTLLIFDPYEEGDMYFKSFLNTSVSEVYLEEVKQEVIEYIHSKKEKVDDKKEIILENICPSLEGEKLDNDSRFKSTKASIVPLVTGDNFYGLIHLSYCRPNVVQSDIEDSLSRAIGATLSVSIDRLQVLDKSQHSKTESLIRSLSDGVIMFTNDKHVVLTNSRATVYTGLFFTSSTLDDFIKLFPGVKLAEMIDNAIEKGVISHINEVLLINKFYEISITPVKDNEGGIVGGSIIIHDITYMKEIDRMKTEFVSVASHQLRTPLTAIKLFTEVLVKGDMGELNKDQKEYLENIYKSTGRMVRLVNDLLNVTRIESGKLRVSPQSTDVLEFIKNLIVEAEASANLNKIEIVFNKCKLPKVQLDQNLFRQVVQNLISNAIRYSKVKGKVEISLSRDDYYYYIEVKDSGIGIPKETQKRIFEKFYRADNAIKAVTAGTGLGLYTSKMIVEISGGKIWFESEEGKGTTFHVKMPLSGMEKKEGERGMMIS